MSTPFIPVPMEFIEKYMPAANPHFVKVYLYILSKCDTSDMAAVNLSDCANTLDMLGSDVDLSIRYWQSQGILKILQVTERPLGYKIQFLLKASQQEPVKAPVQTTITDSKQSFVQKINQNKELQTMLLLAQNILGKPLNPAETKTLFSFHEWLGLPIDVILMLLEYCASQGHTNINYIEKMAISWHELGLNDVCAAENYVNELSKQEAYDKKVKEILNIDIQKNFNLTERKHVSLWKDVYHSTFDLIQLAYEYCLGQIGKMSIPYISAILKSWHEQGITSVMDAKHGNETYKAKSASVANSYSSYSSPSSLNDYDYEEISKLAANKLKSFAAKDNG